MIIYKTGNIFNSNADILVNTVNCVGVMGKGIALEFKKRYPEMFTEYKKLCNQGFIRPGYIMIWGYNPVIINFPTKRHWKHKSLYSDISLGLTRLQEILADVNFLGTIAVPALGCGNGGLDWNIVKSQIETHLNDLKCKILIYEPIR